MASAAADRRRAAARGRTSPAGASPPGYRSELRSIRIEPGAGQILKVSLVARAEPSSRADSVPKKKSWLRNPWLWTAVGVVIAGAVTAAVVVTSSSDPDYEGGSTGRVVRP
jgi:hypothetical protein